MTRANRPRYAARLNAFKQLSPGSDVKDWIWLLAKLGV